MVFRNNYEGLNEYAAETIRIKSLSLVGTSGFTNDDLDDIRQELTLDLLNRIPDYDPEKSAFNTFISGIVDNGIAAMIEARSAAKRDWRKLNTSLNVDVPDSENEWIEQIQIVSREDLPWNDGETPDSPFDKCDRNITLRDAIAILPPRQRELCLLLTQMNISDISSEMGMSRPALYRMIARIRKKLLESGFKNIF